MSYYLGLDIGYSNLKIVMGEAGGKAKELLLPGAAGPLEKMSSRLMSNESDTVIKVSVDGKDWVAGVQANQLEGWERVLDEDFPWTDNYKALYYAALLKTGREKIDRVVTGLPVDQHVNVERREKLAERLKGKHMVAPNKWVEVADVKIVPQPIGALMHQISVSDEEQMEIIEEGHVVVMDPGYFSFDWVAVVGWAFRKESSGTSQRAMSRILEEASRLVEEDHGPGSCAMHKLENAIRDKRSTILVYGERIPYQAYFDQAVANVAPQAMASLRQAMREEDQGADIIILTGGGGLAFKEAAESIFPRSKILVPENPVMANAKGFWFHAH